MSPISREFEDSHILESIKVIEGTYRELGLKLNSFTEIGRCLANARQSLSGTDAAVFKKAGNAKRFHEIVEGTIETLRIGEIIRRVENKEPIRNHLHKMLKGLVDPTTQERTRAKDALFELQMLEHLLAADLEARLGEPDVLFDFENMTYGVACKCLYSANNIGKQFKKARNQINKSGYRGIIALNISSLLDHSAFIEADTEPEFKASITAAVKRFQADDGKPFERWINTYEGKSWVIGIVFVINTFTRWRTEMRISLGTKMLAQTVLPEKHPQTITLRRIVDSWTI